MTKTGGLTNGTSRDAQGSAPPYAWAIVAACFGLTFTLGETFWSFGVLLKPLQHEFGWSRAAVSSMFSAFILGYAISVITSGRLADRYSPKPVLLASASLIACGLCLCSVAGTINHFRFFFWIVGLGSGATWTIPSSIVQRWFYRRRNAGLALGIVLSGAGVGALVFAPLINYLILNQGLRTTFLIMAILFFAIVVSATIVIRPSPVDTGATVEGDPAGVMPARVASVATKRLLRTWAFAAITFVVSAGNFTFQILSAHIVAHATDAGISSSVSAAALGLVGGVSITGRIVSGILAARVGWHNLLSLSFFGMGLATLILLVMKDAWMLYVFVLFYGVFHGVRISGQVGVLPGIFGIRSLGELIGMSSAIAQIISFAAPYLAGLIFDATGSYTPVFLVIFFLMMTAGLAAAMLKRIAAGRVPVET
ncbi:MAG: MFS transporter [Deltaproteobacteria bacterium]|nr:MFS transporter [Deltaproteobacteria bacterium]